MPARRRRRSSNGKPQGSMMSTGTPRQAAEAQEGAGVLRNIGLEQGEAHGADSTARRVANRRCTGRAIIRWPTASRRAHLRVSLSQTDRCAFMRAYKRAFLRSAGAIGPGRRRSTRSDNGAWRTRAGAAWRTQRHDAGETRRDFLMLATGALGAVGVAAVALAVHRPDEPGGRHAGAVRRSRSISRRSQVGQASPCEWRGKPVFIRHRTPEEIKAAEDVDARRAAAIRRPISARVQKGTSSG